jgi:hypothetical protein
MKEEDGDRQQGAPLAQGRRTGVPGISERPPGHQVFRELSLATTVESAQ